MRPVPRPALVLSLMVVVMGAAVSIATLAWDGSFPSASPAPAVNRVLAEGRGWSAATLLIAIPLSLLSLHGASRGSIRARLVWIGSLVYFIYTYLELAVSPPFTAFYLVYVAAFACAIPAVIMGVASVDVAGLHAVLGTRLPRRTVAAFALLFAAILALAWLKEIVSESLAGRFGWPAGEGAVGHVVHALDLGLQVPLGIAAGVLLLRRRPSGDLVAAVWLVNAVCMGAALTAMVAWSSVSSDEFVGSCWPFATVWILTLALTTAFFRLRPGSLTDGRPPSRRPEEGAW